MISFYEFFNFFSENGLWIVFSAGTTEIAICVSVKQANMDRFLLAPFMAFAVLCHD